MTTVALRREEGRVEGLSEGTGVVLGQLAEPGRLTEISGVGAAARHTTAVALVRQAQLEGETTVWVQPAGGPLYPPDLAESGVDLDALVVVHVPEDRGQVGLARAAELLLRSGAYGLCVVDLSAADSACPSGHVHSDMSPQPARPPRLKGSACNGSAGRSRQATRSVIALTAPRARVAAPQRRAAAPPCA